MAVKRNERRGMDISAEFALFCHSAQAAERILAMAKTLWSSLICKIAGLYNQNWNVRFWAMKLCSQEHQQIPKCYTVMSNKGAGNGIYGHGIEGLSKRWMYPASGGITGFPRLTD